MYIKVFKLITIFLGITVFIVGSVYFGYQVFKPIGNENIVLAEEEPLIAEAEAVAEQPDIPRITDETRIMYEYLDSNDNLQELREVTMPYYFLGMDEHDLAGALIEGWNIREFDEDIVVLSRVIDVDTNNYMLGVHNGYIAVYYNENAHAGEVGDVMETTNKPISALSIDEQNRLMNGIPISGEEQLVKVLEDYGS